MALNNLQWLICHKPQPNKIFSKGKATDLKERKTLNVKYPFFQLSAHQNSVTSCTQAFTTRDKNHLIKKSWSLYHQLNCWPLTRCLRRETFTTTTTTTTTTTSTTIYWEGARVLSVNGVQRIKFGNRVQTLAGIVYANLTLIPVRKAWIRLLPARYNMQWR